MNNVKAPYNINKLTASAALSLFRDPVSLSIVQQTILSLLSQRTHLSLHLLSLPFVVSVYPSDANFILFRVTERAYDMYKTLADTKGIICRYRGQELHCTECLRVTIGTERENDEFVRGLVEVAERLGIRKK